MAKCIMIQGTMSGVGKSFLCTALCRIFREDGLRAAPFKSQNMALNSYITPDGLEMGRAQAVQAMAAGLVPDVRMNPILLKPSCDMGSQLILNGRVAGEYAAKDYFKMKRSLIPLILEAYESLAAENDVIVIEGAGSPAEINLKKDDIVNMGLAELVNAPVLLAGDIDRGGVFAQLYGTVALLDEKERKRIRGLIINRFRGDPDILKPGLADLERLTKVPLFGVVPMSAARIDDEDSLSSFLQTKTTDRPLRIAVIRFPRISNFTDFVPLGLHPAIGIRYVENTRELGEPDMVILPGTKSTLADLLWLRERGLAEKILALAGKGIPVLGICGGYQMLGEELSDPYGVEQGGVMKGMGLLPCRTVFEKTKKRTRVQAVCTVPFAAGAHLTGYEIHMGQTQEVPGASPAPFCFTEGKEAEGTVCGNVFGTYLHGVFDSGELTGALADLLLSSKGLPKQHFVPESHDTYQEEAFDLMAKEVRSALDIDRIYAVMEEYAKDEGSIR